MTAVAGLTFAACGAVALVLGCLHLTAVWSNPALGTFDFMLAACTLLGVGLTAISLAWSILKELWRPTLAPGADCGGGAPTGPMDAAAATTEA